MRNNFSPDTRELFYDARYTCFMCNGNGQNCGGMELHHIASRITNSAVNCAPVCKECHEHIGHSYEEEKFLFRKALEYLFKKQYLFTEKDTSFLDSYKPALDALLELKDA
jgi:hypothetical protein